MSEPRVEPGLQPYITMAVDDLSRRLSIEPASVEVRSASLVSWSDGSFGCPRPGMRYAQVPSDGSVIELAVDGTIYRYHSGGSRTPFLCEPGSGTPLPRRR